MILLELTLSHHIKTQFLDKSIGMLKNVVKWVNEYILNNADGYVVKTMKKWYKQISCFLIPPGNTCPEALSLYLHSGL